MNNTTRWKALTEEWVAKTGLSPSVLFTLAVQNIQNKDYIGEIDNANNSDSSDDIDRMCDPRTDCQFSG